MRWFIHFLVTGFGVGLFPRAPGTFGSLVGLASAYIAHEGVLWLASGSDDPNAILYFGLVPALLVTAIAYLVIALEETWSKKHDMQTTVIDEIAGQTLALLWFPPTWYLYVLGFIGFRIFDIWKPSIIGWADRELGGAWGTLLDDLIAGLVTAGLLGIFCLLS